MEAFELRLWDGRLGRWLTVDPYAQCDSPYLGMGNNPISRIDPDGGTDGEPGDPPIFLQPTNCEHYSPNVRGGNSSSNVGLSIFDYLSSISTNAPINSFLRWSITYLNTTGPDDGKTSIWGNKQYYNSTPNNGKPFGFFSNLTEPNNGLHLQYNLSRKYSVGLAYFKQKTVDVNGTGFQHPSAIHATFGRNFKSFTAIGIEFTSSLSLGLGIEEGRPRSFNYQFNGDKIIGFGGSLIYRIDAKFIGNSYLSTAFTVHSMKTFDQSATNYSGEIINSGAISFGGGYKF